MTASIQPLPQDVVNLISAGEVIDSFAAVVKELVENALDAGANRLVVSLWSDFWRIKVVDNGRGMTLQDLRLCSRPHSTSKIQSYDDLWKVSSLGFRGEALHSLAQVGTLEIISRANPGEDEVGWQVIYSSQGEPQKEKTTAIAPGTIVTVSDLFGNWPVRRKGLPRKTQQMKGVQNLIYDLALCHPQITWQVYQNDRPWFNLGAGETSQDILPQILKQIQKGDLQFLRFEIEGEEEEHFPFPSHLELVVGLPDRCHRRRPDWVKVAINGRLIRSPELEQTILSSFARTLPRDRYPVCFIHLHLDPGQIDWNRHPSKTVIYLQHLEFWQRQVSEGIEQALRLRPETLTTTVYNQRVGKLIKTSETRGTYQLNPQDDEGKENANEISFIALRAVAQVNKTYIVAEHPQGLWLVEQHIAHERILYEQLREQWQLIPLEIPIILPQLKEMQIEQLQRLELEIEPFGEDLWAVRTAPQMLAQREDCTDALLELSQGGDLQEAQVATACRSAIRNGMTLSLPEMQNILDQWKCTRNPHTCPHGRPIYLSLEETSLARFFRRHWVIGKSHGI